MSVGPRMREIFERYGVDEMARKEILADALWEVTYRERPPAELEGRLLRAVERRSVTWREQEDAKAEAAETNDGPDGEPER